MSIGNSFLTVVPVNDATHDAMTAE